MIQIVMVGMWTESKHTSQRTLALTHCVFFPLQFEKKKKKSSVYNSRRGSTQRQEMWTHKARERQTKGTFPAGERGENFRANPSGQIIDIKHPCASWTCFNLVLSLCLSHEHRHREATGGNVKWLWLWAQAQTDTGMLHNPQVHCSTS